MANTRGWVFEEDVPEESGEGESAESEETDIQYEIRKQIVQGLVGRWNQLHNQIEEAGWRRQQAHEEGYYEEYDTDEEAAAAERARKIRDGAMLAELDEIANRLRSYGARMMRPYEHWNEEEKYMEYMERDRDDEY